MSLRWEVFSCMMWPRDMGCSGVGLKVEAISEQLDRGIPFPSLHQGPGATQHHREANTYIVNLSALV